MKLLTYIFTNTVSLWGFLRKGFLRCAGLLLLWCIGFYIRANSFLSPSSIQWFLTSDDINKWLESAIFLQSGEYIDIQEDAIMSNKSGALFSWDDTLSYQNLESCEKVFNDNAYADNAVVIIPSWICIINNNKQQVVTVKQLREARASIQSELWSGSIIGFMENYPVIAGLLSGEVVRIDNAVLTQIVKTEIPTLFADKEFLSWVDSLLRLFSGWMMIPLYIIWLFLIVWLLLVIVIVRMFYSLATRWIATLLKNPITNFEQACSVSWLPLLLLSVVLDTIILLPWWWDLLIFCFIMTILMYFYFVDKWEWKNL